MEKKNYFTGELSVENLENYFDSLNEEGQRCELENFSNQFLELPEKEQLKYVISFLEVCRDFEEKIDKRIEKKILETLNKILPKNPQAYSWYEIFCYLSILYNYLSLTKEYEEYSKLIEKESHFFSIINCVKEDNFERKESIYPNILSVFAILFFKNSFPKEKRILLETELESFINFLFKNNDLKNNDFQKYHLKYFIYWYLKLDGFVSIFQFDHLETINNYFFNNPQSNDVKEYLDFVSRNFDVVQKIVEENDSDTIRNQVIKLIDVIRKIAEENDSDIIRNQVIKLIDVIRKIAEENDSDIIRNQAIKLIEKYTNDYLNMNSISSLDADQLLEEAEKNIYYIRSKLTVDATELKEIGSFGHYTKIDTLTNFLIKADWKDDNENVSKVNSPFLRLTNLKQLNDPMEGRAIYDYLGMDNTFFHNYQTSNVFLSSLTIVSDSLPMWKEYADSSQGAFLEYDLSYLADIVAHKSIEFVKVHYLDLMSENKDETDIGKFLVNLKLIFEKLQELEAEKELISFAEKLKKISYLFKVKDYEYEMEYCILINLDDTAVQNIINRDANDSSNDKYFKKEDIGLEIFDKVNYNDFRKYIVLSPKDNGRYDLFVYINLAPLKYSKVILGPKVTDADYIAPYLKLANPDIKIESSKIPYR